MQSEPDFLECRIGIARAVYDHARNVLIDDVFAFSA